MRLLPFFAGLMLAACAGPVAPPGAALAGVTAGRVASPPRTCIESTGDNLRAVDSATLAYGSGRTIYINRLGGSCPGLRELSTIIVELHGSQYCRGDRIRANEPGSIIPGPTCNLGVWVPYRR